MTDVLTAFKSYQCKCTSDNGTTYYATLSHKDPVAAAIEFAELIDTVKNHYPFLNGRMSAVSVTDRNTQVTIKYLIEVRKTPTYHPKTG